jgi:hypothetical protein
MPVFDQIKFTTDDGLQAPLVRFVDKLEGPEHVSVVGQGDALLAVAQRLVHHLRDVRSAVEQRVLRVAVEMCECWHGGINNWFTPSGLTGWMAATEQPFYFCEDRTIRTGGPVEWRGSFQQGLSKCLNFRPP